MQDNEKKPALRFKGFTDPWEQRKLEEYLKVSGQKNFEGIYTKEDVLSVSGDFGIVNQIEFQGRSFAGASVANYGVVETGDIVYTKSPLKSNPYGIIKANKGKNGIVSTLYAVYKPKQSANPEFVQIYFEQDARMNNYMHPLVNKGAKNDMKVSAENALKGQIVFPDIKEQRTISEFFRNLDTLITLHQRKYEKLVNIKKSMLNKMFPQNGASVPEIRFKGFTDPWEQRKLGELSRSFEYGLNAAAKEYDGQNKYLRITDIDDTSRQFVSADITSPDANLAEADNYRLSDGDVLFARTGASVGKTYLYKKSDGLVYFAGFLIRAKIKESVSAGFIFQNTLTRSYERYIAITSQRSGQPGVNAQEYAEYQLMLPELFEQEKIAKLLEALDTLITLHQRKLEKLQNIKKSCLEKMFV